MTTALNWTLLTNSLLVAGASTVLAMFLGFAVALIAAAAPAVVRKPLIACCISALALPSFLVTNCWIDLLGATGKWHALLPLNIFSLAGTVWVLSLILWPIPALAIHAAWQKIEPVHFEVDPALRGSALVRRLLWPTARPLAFTAAAVVFALALNNFGVPAILQVKVFSAEVWVQFNTNLDAFAALQSSWPLILMPVALLLLVRQPEFPWPRESGADFTRPLRRQLGRIWLAFAALVCTVVIALGLFIPLLQLAGAQWTWSEFAPAVAAGMPALTTSFIYAVAAAALSVTIGLLLARVRALGWMWLLFLVPGVLLGIGALTAFNHPGLDFFSRTSAIVITLLVVRYLALARSINRTALRSVDTALIESGRLDGAAGVTLFRRIVLPQIAPQVGAVAYIVYLLCLWDVETILLVVPPGGETLALRIFNLLHYGHNAHVNALCMLLLLLGLAPLALFFLWSIVRGSNSGSGWSDWSAESEPQASVATKELRWVGSQIWSNPGVEARADRGRIQPFQGCSLYMLSFPRVARASQSWAVRWNPFKILLVTACLVFFGCDRRTDRTPNAAPLRSSIFSHVEIIGSRGTGAGQFNKPRSLALDAKDNLFVVDLTGRVQKFSPEGKFLLSWQMPQTDLGKPKGMCRDRDGNIVVLEPHYQRVNHFTPDGTLVAQWGVKGTNAGELTLPRAIAVDTKNNVIVSEYTLVDRVQKFSAQGRKCLATWGTPGLANAEFNRAEGVCVDAADRIYVADSCNHRIQIFSNEGKFVRTYGKAGERADEMSYPYDIQVDEQGRQFVCEFGNSRIQVFDANDRPLEIIGHAGGGPGEFANPWSIALDSKGNLYVADSQNHRVQKLVRVAPASRGSRSASGRTQGSAKQPDLFVPVAAIVAVISAGRRNERAGGPCYR